MEYFCTEFEAKKLFIKRNHLTDQELLYDTLKSGMKNGVHTVTCAVIDWLEICRAIGDTSSGQCLIS